MDHCSASRRLSITALDAARAGDWDLVERCYAERETCLAAEPIDAALASALLAIDRQVQSAALAARTAVGELLAENGRTKQHLRQLKSAHAAVPGPTGRRVSA